MAWEVTGSNFVDIFYSDLVQMIEQATFHMTKLNYTQLE